MKRKSSIALGPGAPSLILIFVTLAMSVLGMLSLMTARNDLKLSERSAEVVQAVFLLNERSEENRQMLAEMLAERSLSPEEALAGLEQTLPEGFSTDGNKISWLETDGERTLDCAVACRLEEGAVRLDWIRHSLRVELDEEDIWD